MKPLRDGSTPTQRSHENELMRTAIAGKAGSIPMSFCLRGSPGAFMRPRLWLPSALPPQNVYLRSADLSLSEDPVVRIAHIFSMEPTRIHRMTVPNILQGQMIASKPRQSRCISAERPTSRPSSLKANSSVCNGLTRIRCTRDRCYACIRTNIKTRVGQAVRVTSQNLSGQSQHLLHGGMTT
ncbi:hypothetical protein FHT77_003323 [Rhizobium sp. BK181]|nr:hypothetical protein [Rhizobium sp. BK181]